MQKYSKINKHCTKGKRETVNGEDTSDDDDNVDDGSHAESDNDDN